MKPWNGPFANTLTVGMLAFMLASPASAAFTYFSDEGLFNSAHSLPLTMEGFEGFSTGDGEPVVASDFTLTTTAGTGGINQSYLGVYATEGVNYFGWVYGDNTSLTIAFDSPQSVFSMDFTDLASVGAITIDVFADGGLAPVVPTINIDHGFNHGYLDFLGLVSDSPFSTLEFSFAVSEWAGVDRIQYGASPVPLPAAVWLFGAALFGLAGFTRRKQSA